ncbi:ERF017 protein [Hibiscus syriacus]|uniref:ERF017 protein n=1 Tax=Hibiscus syriacus TaxID=106335 RepID=A0A6A2Z8J1_HIBSY|nr:ethylene-responsive transcription factor ERF017-like [Hibiscus syriacus]KAE8687836.1 ERF017 protein [Hibiscus syriacus]
MVKQHVSQSHDATETQRIHSRFKGARKRKWGKWVSEIRLPNSRERIWLGSYNTAEKAARAFDAALFCLRGRSAKFNFPDNPPDIAGGRTLTTSEIQAVAARFANSEPPMTHSEQYTYGFQTEPPSPSVSVDTARYDGELSVDGSFLDALKKGSGYGIFPELDDFSIDFLGSLMPEIECEEDNLDEISNPEYFLWNF